MTATALRQIPAKQNPATQTRLERRCEEMLERQHVRRLVESINAQRKADPAGERSEKVIQFPWRKGARNEAARILEESEKWSRAEVLGLADSQCKLCLGRGNLLAHNGGLKPCPCVLRSIFRICLNRQRMISWKQDSLETAAIYHLDSRRSPVNRAKALGYSRPDEEFLADMHLIAKRTLTASEFFVFRAYLLGGRDYKLMLGPLRLDRGKFFHMVYRVEEKLGMAFRCTKPYPLFPLDEYFGRKAAGRRAA